MRFWHFHPGLIGPVTCMLRHSSGPGQLCIWDVGVTSEVVAEVLVILFHKRGSGLCCYCLGSPYSAQIQQHPKLKFRL